MDIDLLEVVRMGGGTVAGLLLLFAFGFSRQNVRRGDPQINAAGTRVQAG